ncbi:hypothetical protein LCGC14_1374230, partial [marine sediment metagenome]
MNENILQKQKLEFHPHQIKHDSIIVDGHTGNITFEAMRWLMKHNVQLTLLNWNGNLLASTLPQAANAGKLKIKQYQKYLDNKTRFEIAQKNPLIILDGAHNPAKVKTFLTSLTKIIPDKKFVFLVAFKKGKDIDKMLELL